MSHLLNDVCPDSGQNKYFLAISWKYYARDAAHLWTAPTAFQDICNPASAGSGFVCTGGDWINNVQAVLPANPPVLDGMAPPISDMEECNLPAVSWVTPDGSYSDHPGKNADFKGPAWVAALVNNIGNKPACPKTGEVYWKDTVILITWDDWGGWYDHVTPPIGYAGSQNPSAQYVYGFRVPLLVVSAYNVHGTGSFTGYVSGACQSPGNCPNYKAPFIHDFGSILNFTEYALGSGGQPLSLNGHQGIGDPNYPYADFLAPDAPHNCPTCAFSLSDFFVPNLNQNPTPTPFQTITLPPVLQNYGAQYFEDYLANPGDPPPADPDDDAIDEPAN